jgi:hypothetical protein
MQATQEKTMSRELRAICHIVLKHAELKRKAFPHINLENESINWEGIFNEDYGGGYLAALQFAKALWCDRVATKGDPFDRAFAMDLPLRRTVLEALAIRWGLQ